MHATTLPTDTEFAAHTSQTLITAGLSANTAWRIVDLLPPAGHHALVNTLNSDPNALHSMLNLPWGEFADRFRTSDTDAIRIQTELAAALR